MSNESDAQQLAAALEQLEIERRRREDEKIVAGEAVRVPFPPVVWREDEDIHTAIKRLKAREMEKLRANGETREIVFEESDYLVIVTGVPRHGECGKWKPSILRRNVPVGTGRLSPARKRSRQASPPRSNGSE